MVTPKQIQMEEGVASEDDTGELNKDLFDHGDSPWFMGLW